MTFLYQNFNFLQSNFLMTFVLVVSYSWNVLSIEKWNNDWDKSSTVDIYDDRKYLRNPKWVTKAWTVSHLKFWGDHPPPPPKSSPILMRNGRGTTAVLPASIAPPIVMKCVDFHVHSPSAAKTAPPTNRRRVYFILTLIYNMWQRCHNDSSIVYCTEIGLAQCVTWKVTSLQDNSSVRLSILDTQDYNYGASSVGLQTHRQQQADEDGVDETG